MQRNYSEPTRSHGMRRVARNGHPALSIVPLLCLLPVCSSIHGDLCVFLDQPARGSPWLCPLLCTLLEERHSSFVIILGLGKRIVDPRHYHLVSPCFRRRRIGDILNCGQVSELSRGIRTKRALQRRKGAEKIKVASLDNQKKVP